VKNGFRGEDFMLNEEVEPERELVLSDNFSRFKNDNAVNFPFSCLDLVPSWIADGAGGSAFATFFSFSFKISILGEFAVLKNLYQKGYPRKPQHIPYFGLYLSEFRFDYLQSPHLLLYE
jgi:hypothetical protein